MKENPKLFGSQKVSSFVIKKNHNFSETYFNKVETSGVVLKIELKSNMVDWLPGQKETLKH